MSKQALTQVVERASEDALFRQQLASNPENTLANYDLTPDERAALLSNDPKRLSDLGVDARITKSYWDNFNTPFTG